MVKKVLIVLMVTLTFPVAVVRSQDDQGWGETWRGFSSAYKNYDRVKYGTASLHGPTRIIRGGYGSWTITYKAGNAGIARNGGIAVASRHLSGWGIPQTLDPGGVNFTTASTSSSFQVQLHALERFVIWNDYFLQFFPWQHVTRVEVRDRVEPGQTITLTLGDESFGSPGYRAPSIARDRAFFHVFVDDDGDGIFQAIPDPPSVEIIPGPGAKLSVILPSQCGLNQPTRMLVRVEDDQGNLAVNYHGTVTLSTKSSGSSLPDKVTFTAADKGKRWLENIRFGEEGIIRISARGTAISAATDSNPMRCSRSEAKLATYWGDLHGHSILSDGTGTPQQYFEYGRDVAALDFLSLTDHAEMMDELRWQLVQAVTDRFNEPHRFATIYGYEWSGLTADGGHHNVFYLKRGLPLFRSSNSENDINPWLYFGGTDVAAGHIARLYQRLEALPGANGKEILVIPHWRGATATPQWQHHLSPLIEVASEAGYHEQWAQSFVTPQSQVGFSASSDDHYGRPGYGMDDRFENPWNKTRLGSPLTAALTMEMTREEIFGALFNRHVYATTGARILLSFRADDRMMGDDYRTQAQSVSFKVSIGGTSPLKSVEVKRVLARPFKVTDPVPDERERGEVIYRHKINAGELDVDFSFPYEWDLRSASYYLHVVQEDGEQAVSSPILIRSK